MHTLAEASPLKGSIRWNCVSDYRLIGRDINLEILRVEGYRKFCNKIFNATKFAMLKLDETFVPQSTPKVGEGSAYQTGVMTDVDSAHW